jgi:hypothetical protein
MSASMNWIAWKSRSACRTRPLGGVLARGVVGTARDAERERRNRDPPAIEHLHRVNEAVPDLAEHVRVGTRQSSRISSAVSEARMPSLFSFLPGGSRAIHLDGEGGDPALLSCGRSRPTPPPPARARHW